MILDLNGKTITYDRTGTSETATAINVNGSEVDIVIKNGTIEVLAAKGKDGSYSWGNEKNGGTGKDAVCIQRKNIMDYALGDRARYLWSSPSIH